MIRSLASITSTKSIASGTITSTRLVEREVTAEPVVTEVMDRDGTKLRQDQPMVV